ncbi:Appr-1-p processing protein [Kosakonia sp. BK9b]
MPMPESLSVSTALPAVEYRKSAAEFIAGEGVLYTEFMGEIATRQISVLDGVYHASASLKERNDKIGYLLYDGQKSELDLSASPIITRREFEEVWSVALGYCQEKHKIQYVTGNAAVPVGASTIIAHIVNTQGEWDKGFVLSLSENYPSAREAYSKCYAEEKSLSLGDTQFINADAENSIFVANMICQDGSKNSDRDQKQSVSYPALEKCLSLLSDFALAHRLSVQMPLIAPEPEGGDGKEIERLIEKHVCYKRIECRVFTGE